MLTLQNAHTETLTVLLDDEIQFMLNTDDSATHRNFDGFYSFYLNMKSTNEKAIINEYLERGLNIESFSDERLFADIISPIMEKIEQSTFTEREKLRMFTQLSKAFASTSI